MSRREPWPIGGPWVVTDDYQRARRIGKRTYKLGEVRAHLVAGERKYVFVLGTINLDEVPATEIETAVKAFYDSIEGLESAYPGITEAEVDELMAECYFERIPTLALCFSNPTSTAEEAMQLLEAFAPTA